MVLKRLFLFVLLVIQGTLLIAQEETETDSIPDKRFKNDIDIPFDAKYREDQFYFGFNYNLILGLPEEANLRGLTGGIQMGYLRDMPINERRNMAIAVGLGVSLDRYGQNVFIGEDERENSLFDVLDEDQVSFDRNRFSTAVIEVPLEFRWRTSTHKSYRFWRIYGGVRAGYAYWYQSTFKQDENEVIQTDIPEFNPLRMSATLSFGYNKINFFAAYTVTPFFDDATTARGDTVEFIPLKLGFIFYIL